MLKVISFIYVNALRIFGIEIRQHVKIRPLVYIAKGYASGKKGRILIDERCELSLGVVLKAHGGLIYISKNTFLGEYVTIYGHGGVNIGSNTLIAMHTCIVSSNHAIPRKGVLIRSKGDVLLPVKIGNDVWIGAGAKILGGVSIGDGCVIGAGAVVSKSLPPFAIAMGVPAQITGYRND
ncbi:MAG TPA: acyltransferase [Mucilaginibacter sp.]|nr:acyltransferase [Mucilaginibacter sp.]